MKGIQFKLSQQTHLHQAHEERKQFYPQCDHLNCTHCCLRRRGKTFMKRISVRNGEVKNL
jgi:hypothetical protein